MTLSFIVSVTRSLCIMSNGYILNTRLAVPVLFMSSAGWGLTWLPLKALSDMGLDGMHLILIAFLSGALLLSPWLYKQYPLWRQRIAVMLAIAAVGGFANVAFQTAIYHGEVIRVMILFYMLPVWSVLGGWIFLKEKVDAARLITVGLCLFGAYIILDIQHTSWGGISWIDVLAIGSGMGLAATNILFRFTPDIPVASKVASTFVGCAVLIGFSLMVFTTAATLPENGAVPLAIAYGAFWLTLITLGTQWGVTQMEIGRSAIIIVMELVVAVASTALIFAAGLQLYEVIGGLMVISAAILEGSRSEEIQPA